MRLTHKIIGIDTVDVNFGIVNITGKRKIHFNNGLNSKKRILLWIAVEQMAMCLI